MVLLLLSDFLTSVSRLNVAAAVGSSKVAADRTQNPKIVGSNPDVT